MNDKLVRKHFSYNPLTGEFLRTTRKNANGSIDKDGYLIVKFMRKQYKAHRLIWLYTYGTMPNGVIDHINRNRLDNRITNLRDTTQAVNVENTNRTPNINTGVIGVHYDSTNGLKKNYATRINGKTIRFATAQEASNARKANGLTI